MLKIIINFMLAIKSKFSKNNSINDKGKNDKNKCIGIKILQ